ncbi:MAG TPA: tRNA pseudouridine(55) synthase TruB [Candidatus Scatovivens faecipullorum]|nr:tRNA pseudouridine(55) synthase TruB [Candidatus Scatovivens faecipullorum]
MQGILIINKPQGYTSQDVVSKVKKILNIKKAGHTGTLDPLATGVLPIMLGNYTKLSKYLIEHDKIYLAKIKLGEKKDTGDEEGKTIEEKEVLENNLNKENVEEILKKFSGRQKQIPPIYSAIKVNGKKLYEYAREGKKVEIPEREIEIYSIKLKNINLEEKEIEFEVNCSKGTYIRVLCEDIANKLDTVGYMSNLERIKVDDFDIRDSVTLEDLEKNKDNKMFLERSLINMETIFKDLPQISLNNRKKELFLNGVMLSIENKEGLYNIYNNNVYLGTGTIKNNLLKRDVII